MTERKSGLSHAEAGGISMPAMRWSNASSPPRRDLPPGGMEGLGWLWRAVRPARGRLSGPGAGRRNRWRRHTKLRIGIDTGELDGLGIDLVAMCVNGLVCQGARKPLFFSGLLRHRETLSVDEATRASSTALPKAAAGPAVLRADRRRDRRKMPGMYARGDFDLAGFCGGRDGIGAALPAGVADGDVLGSGLDGVHLNGFSLCARSPEHAGLD